MKDLLPILEQTAKMGAPMVIIAETSRARPWRPCGEQAARDAADLRGESAWIRRSPQGLLEDLAILTGGSVISEDLASSSRM